MTIMLWHEDGGGRQIIKNVFDIRFEYQPQNGNSYWMFYTQTNKYDKLAVFKERAIEIDYKHDHITILK